MNRREKERRKNFLQRRRNENALAADELHDERGLRVTREYFALKDVQRAFWVDGFYNENTGSDEVAVFDVKESRERGRSRKDKFTIKRHQWKLNDTKSQEAEKLYQDEPDDVCLYTKYTGIRLYTPTNSRESRQNWAWKELMILLRKGRIPTFEIRLNFFVQFAKKKYIDELREMIRRCLKYRGISALIVIGLTRGKDGRPNNTVHFHYLMGDKENDDTLQTEDETRQRREEITGYMRKVCERQGLVLHRDFKIDSRELWDGEQYFAYLVKYGKYGKDIPLFIEGLNMQEFTQTGWFERGEKERLWEAFRKEKYGDEYFIKSQMTETANDDTES